MNEHSGAESLVRDSPYTHYSITLCQLHVGIHDRFPDSTYSVVLGTTVRLATKTEAWHVRVQKITLHPDYNRPLKHSFDFALLFLEQAVPVRVQRWIKPACLNTRPQRPGQMCVVIGYGETNGYT